MNLVEETCKKIDGQGERPFLKHKLRETETDLRRTGPAAQEAQASRKPRPRLRTELEARLKFPATFCFYVRV